MKPTAFDNLASNRYVLAAIPYSLLVGLLACTQSVETGFAEQTSPPNLPADSQAKQTDEAYETCAHMSVYDPADTSVNMHGKNNIDSVVASLPNLTRVQGKNPVDIVPEWNIAIVTIDSEQGGTAGYVWGDFLYRSYSQVLNPQAISANLRESSDGTVIAELDNGTMVQFAGIEGDWTKVELNNGQQGYILSALLAPPNCP